MDHQRLDAPQGRSARWDREGIDERGCGRTLTQVHGHQPATVAQLPPRDGRLGMGVETRVGDSSHLRTRLECMGEHQCAGRVAVHAHVQRFHASQDQEGREGRDHAARLDLRLAYLRHQLRVARDRPRQHVRMTADPLGRGLDHQVCPQLERTAQIRRGEGVIDDHDGTTAVGAFRQVYQVRDHDGGIGDRLQVQHARGCPEGILDRIGVRRVDILDLYPEPREHR